MEEIELKILEIDRAGIEERLAGFAEKKWANLLLRTITFSNPYNEASLRLRTAGENTFFTVKVFVPDKEFKVRKELETAIRDPEVFKAQLELLGFRAIMLQEKKRTTYRYKDCGIFLDQYPNMPPYLEIEGTRKTIRDIVERLGFGMDETTSASVYELFAQYGIDAGHLVFSETR